MGETHVLMPFKVCKREGTTEVFNDVAPVVILSKQKPHWSLKSIYIPYTQIWGQITCEYVSNWEWPRYTASTGWEIPTWLLPSSLSSLTAFFSCHSCIYCFVEEMIRAAAWWTNVVQSWSRRRPDNCSLQRSRSHWFCSSQPEGQVRQCRAGRNNPTFCSS